MSSASPPCPRCPGRRLDPRNDFHICPECLGLWIARERLSAVEPRLAQIALHADRALAGQTPYGGIARCPGCAAPPATFPYFDVLIDWCVACGGVWLDGPDLKALREGIAEARSRGDEAAGLRHFRQQAVEAVTIGTVRCARCGERVTLTDTWMWENGTVCSPCGHTLRYGVEPPSPEELAAITSAAAHRGVVTRLLRWVLALDDER